MEIDFNPTTATAAGGAAVMAGAVLRKFYLDWMKGRSEAASASAMTEQFKVLQESIKNQGLDLTAVKAEMHRMDVVIHKQQTKLTRTEMLLRQFVGLILEHKIAVPAFMQEELADLLKLDQTAP